jgi:hypothetical protein
MLPPRLPLPQLVQLYRWITRPIEFMEEAPRRLLPVRFPNSPPFVFTSDPEVITSSPIRETPAEGESTEAAGLFLREDRRRLRCWSGP